MFVAPLLVTMHYTGKKYRSGAFFRGSATLARHSHELVATNVAVVAGRSIEFVANAARVFPVAFVGAVLVVLLRKFSCSPFGLKRVLKPGRKGGSRRADRESVAPADVADLLDAAPLL